MITLYELRQQELMRKRKEEEARKRSTRYAGTYICVCGAGNGASNTHCWSCGRKMR